MTQQDLLVKLGDIHGRERAIDYMLTIPDVFIQILKDKETEHGTGREQAD